MVVRWRRWALVVALAFTLGAGLAITALQQAALQREAEEELFTIARLKADQIVAWRSERAGDAAVLAESPIFASAVSAWLDGGNGVNEGIIRAHLEAVQHHYEYHDVMLLAPQGEVLLSLHHEVDAHREETLPALEEALQRGAPVFSPLHYGDAAHVPHFTVVAPVRPPRGGEGPAQALVALVTDADEFLYPLIRQWPTESETAETLLIRRDGEEVLFLNALRYREDAALNLRLPFSQADLPAVMAAQGFHGLVRGRDYRGVPVLAAVLPVPDSPWFMVSKIDVREALWAARVRGALTILLTLGAMALLVAVGVAQWKHEEQSHLRTLYAAQQRQVAILHGIGDAVIATDAHGHVELLNPVAEELTGWQADEAHGQPLPAVFPIVNEHTRAPVPNPVERVLAEGRVVGLANHTILIARDGSERAIADAGAPVRDDAGEITGVVLVFRDQTQERQQAEALRQAEARQRRAAQAGNVGLWDWDLRTDEVYYSPEWKGQLGYEEHEVGNRLDEWETRVHPDDLAPAMERVRAYLAAPWPDFRNEFRMRHKDGSYRHILAQAELVYDDEGQPARMMGSHVDITELRAIEGEMRAQAEERASLLQSMMNAFVVFESVFDDDGQFVSYRFEYINAAYEAITDVTLDEVRGKTVHEVWPGTEPEWIEAYGSVAVTGEPRVFDMYHEPTAKEYHCHVFRPWPTTDRFCVVFEDITVHREFERRLAESEARLRQVFGAMGDGVAVYEPVDEGQDFAFADMNPAGVAITRQRREDLLGRRVTEVFPGVTDLGLLDVMRSVLRTGRTEHLPTRRYEDGQLAFWTENTVSRLPNGHVLAVFRDMTAAADAQRRQEDLRAQLLQAQKLESVGRLAGGVAHDFNNMLQAILGNTALVLEDPALPEHLRSGLEEVVHAGQRSADLTRQLLAFARQQPVSPRVLDLNDAVTGMLRMVRRLIGEDINLSWRPGPNPWPVSIDPTQLHQLLVNLCVNARDAIDGTGSLTIETRNVEVDESYCADNVEASPGQYVMLSVSDDGCGMDRETLELIFEPFFTTKPVGEGTGLGLATVYGVVKQNGGFVNVYSEPGQGTTFRIYLPRVERPAEEPEAHAAPREAARGDGETILYVEDEEAILTLGRVMLGRMGYRVIAAATPAEALRQAEAHPGEIDLLITDVVMPEMNGRDLAERIAAMSPGTRVLFMSGYTSDIIAKQGVIDGGARFLQKPFSLVDLGDAVQKALARTGMASGGEA